jgi:hypothetical protein
MSSRDHNVPVIPAAMAGVTFSVYLEALARLDDAS